MRSAAFTNFIGRQSFMPLSGAAMTARKTDYAKGVGRPGKTRSTPERDLLVQGAR